MKRNSGWLILVFLFLSGCSTSPKDTPRFAGQPSPKIPDGYTPAKANRIELVGQNCCAQVLPNGQQIIYLSRHRPRHEHFQIYIYDEQTKQERRLSFHDGDDQGPVWDMRSNRIFYGSTTDYLKEHPQYLLKALGKTSHTPPAIGSRPLWSLMAFDLYSSGRDGTDISRLTSHVGYEGEVTLHPAKPEMIFTAIENEISVLKVANADGSHARLFVKPDGHDSEPRFSPDGKDVAWVRTNADGSSSQIWTAKSDGRKARALTSLGGIQQSPSWTANGQEILFSSNSGEPSNFEIYVVRKDGSCVRRLTFELGFDGLPTAKPNGKQILFTSDRTGPYQIFEMELAPQACPD